MSSPLVVVPQRLRDLSHAIDGRRAELADRTPAGALDSTAAAAQNTQLASVCRAAAYNTAIIREQLHRTLEHLSANALHNASAFESRDSEVASSITLAASREGHVG